MTDKIELTRHYAHPIQKVWEAISQQEKISYWFIKANFKAEVGYNYVFTHGQSADCTTVKGSVKEVSPPNKLVYTWVVDGTSTETIVSWTLKEQDGGTLLTITHSGISEYHESAADFFKSFSEGWDNCANELAKYLDKIYA